MEQEVEGRHFVGVYFSAIGLLARMFTQQCMGNVTI
jgi:hypothetical protein